MCPQQLHVLATTSPVAGSVSFILHIPYDHTPASAEGVVKDRDQFLYLIVTHNGVNQLKVDISVVDVCLDSPVLPVFLDFECAVFAFDPLSHW